MYHLITMVKDGFITPKKRLGRRERADRWAQSYIEDISRKERVQACREACVQACREACVQNKIVCKKTLINFYKI